MKLCCLATNWIPAAIDIRLIVDHITNKCSSAHTWLWKLVYCLYWQTFPLFEARIVTNQEITVECEWNDKVLKTEVYCIERLNYDGTQFQKQWNGNGQLFCTWWKCFTLQLCMIGVFFFFSGEGSSGSEDENSEDDSDSRDHAYRCQHCFATSKLLALWNFLTVDSRGM